jgi:O-succinylbenzoic acid--CoA ligase
MPRPEAAYIVSTSGSEGQPRGVVLTDDNLAAAVAGSRQRLGNEQDDSWLCVLPLFHVGGLSILWRQAEAGAPVVLLDHFETESVAEALGGVTFASLVPVMLHRLVRTGRQWTGLTVALIGGAAADDRLLSAARAAGIPAIPSYGMTETCSQIATPVPGAALDGSVGVALSGVEIRVVAGGQPVVGTEGGIEVQGPMVSPGYVGEPRRDSDAWLPTGDIGTIDGEGRLTVMGRSDRVIISGGENVHPMAVERLLMANSAIHRARVFGVPDSEWGMRIVAEVESDVGVEALEAWASSKIAPSMRPRQWHLVSRVEDKLG